MSDIAVTIPPSTALAILAVLNWPVLATIAAALAVTGVILPVRWVRLPCLVGAAGIAAGCGLAFWAVLA